MELKSPLKYTKGQKTSITQRFGENPEFYSPMKGHNGIDFVNGYQKSAYGTGIVAVHDGKVSRVISNTPMSTMGNGVYIIKQEGDTLYRTIYWHLSEVLVKAGQEVKQGQLIGRMGNSGIVRPVPTTSCPYCGTHLHFGLYPYIKKDGTWVKQFKDNGYNGAVDPMPYFSDNTISLNFKEQQEAPLILNRIAILMAPLFWAINKLKGR